MLKEIYNKTLYYLSYSNIFYKFQLKYYLEYL